MQTGTPPPELDPDRYVHGYHAGNVGDVLKHLILVATLDALGAGRDRPLAVLDSHAGSGRYRLGPTGEWTAGVGRLDAALSDAPTRSQAAPALRAYLDAVDPPRVPDRGGRYPGSPALSARALGARGSLRLHEIDPVARGELAALFAGDDRVALHDTDGFAAVADGAVPADLLLVDPPYTAKSEWAQAAAAVVAGCRARPKATALLWYPIKSASRPAGLKNAVRDAGLTATAIELLSTPFETDSKRRKALNGSGVLLVNPPAGVVGATLAALATVGPLLATRGRWQLALDAWGEGVTQMAETTGKSGEPSPGRAG